MAHRPDTPSSYDPTGRLTATARRMGTEKELRRLMKTAVRVHEPHAVHEEDTPELPTRKKTIMRKVEVPVTRKVRVPITTTKLVPQVVKQRVKTKKLVEVPAYKEVDEIYTVVKERPVVRDKEVWVKKIVKETVMEPYEVKMRRKKRVPTTEIREVDAYQDVEVETNKVVTVDGYRVDEVQDTKLVEVAEEVEFEYEEREKAKRVVDARELGRVPRARLARTLGQKTYFKDDYSVQDADSDSDPDDVEVAPRQPLKARIGFTLRQSTKATSDPPIVADVQAGGPAAKAGIQPGDRILAVESRPVQSIHTFRANVTATEGPVALTVQRNGQTFNVPVKRKARSAYAAALGTSGGLAATGASIVGTGATRS